MITTRIPLNDRFVRGFIAGVIGSIPMNLVSYISSFFNYTKLTFVDWAAVMIYGKKAVHMDEIILAQLAQVLFAGLVGVAFVYLVPYVSNRALYLKGIVFGVSVWFILNGITLLFKVKKLIPVMAPTAITQSTATVVYSIFMVGTLIYLERYKV